MNAIIYRMTCRMKDEEGVSIMYSLLLLCFSGSTVYWWLEVSETDTVWHKKDTSGVYEQDKEPTVYFIMPFRTPQGHCLPLVFHSRGEEFDL